MRDLALKQKVYHYHFWTEPVIDPMLYPYRLHMRKPFCQKRAQEALKFFIGEKDFTSFCKLKRIWPRDSQCDQAFEAFRSC